MELELGNGRYLDRIFSASSRRALGQIVLATYRVELTRTLSRVAGSGAIPGDAEQIVDVARRIGTTAAGIGLAAIRDGAGELQSKASTLPALRDKHVEAQMLVCGLKLIDTILACARADLSGTDVPAASLN